jgi:hypothetical protein
MAQVFRTLRGRVGTADDGVDDQALACTCASCKSSGPTSAAGAPPPPDMATIIRDINKGRPAVAPAAVDKTQAPASIDFVEAVKQQRGGK